MIIVTKSMILIYAAELVKANTPSGLRAAVDSKKHHDFIKSLAEAL